MAFVYRCQVEQWQLGLLRIQIAYESSSTSYELKYCSAISPYKDSFDAHYESLSYANKAACSSSFVIVNGFIGATRAFSNTSASPVYQSDSLEGKQQPRGHLGIGRQTCVVPQFRRSS